LITKDFHSTKDFRQIRGKSFVIMTPAPMPTGPSGHIRQRQDAAQQATFRIFRGIARVERGGYASTHGEENLYFRSE
jgi:hypothetical protein